MQTILCNYAAYDSCCKKELYLLMLKGTAKCAMMDDIIGPRNFNSYSLIFMVVVLQIEAIAQSMDVLR